LDIRKFLSKNEYYKEHECRPLFRSGIKFSNMEVCKKKCPRLVPLGLKHDNYCREKYGIVACFPPDMKFN